MFGIRRKAREKKLKKTQIKGAPLITYQSPKSVQSEQFRTIRTNLEFVNLDESLKSFIVTSSIPSEGKSTISSNLAYMMGQTENRVLLVDADLRKPMVHRTFNLSNEEGLSSLISNREMKINDVIQYSPDLNLYLLPAGPIPPNPSELLSSARMSMLMEEFNKYFDLVIYDTPPINAVTDAQIMAAKVDGVVFAVREGYVTKDEVRKSKTALDNVNARILGYITNDKSFDESSNYYAYYGYTEEN